MLLVVIVHALIRESNGLGLDHYAWRLATTAVVVTNCERSTTATAHLLALLLLFGHQFAFVGRVAELVLEQHVIGVRLHEE